MKSEEADTALKKKVSRVIYHAFIIAIGVLMVYPLVWMVCSSFKESGTIFYTAGKLIPEKATLENYINGWKGFSHTTFTTFYGNTFFIVILATIGSVVSSVLVAYGLSRLRFRLRGILFALVLLTMMLPSQILMIPQYLWYNKLGWINTRLPLIVEFFFATQGFFVYLLMNFMNGIPRDLDEAAKIDGCSHYTIFTRIVLPLSKPAIATVAIFSFMNRWNDYTSPLLYLKRTDKYTISLALKLFCDSTGTSDYGSMFAMATISLIPIFLIFVFMQKYLTEGIATSGIKG